MTYHKMSEQLIEAEKILAEKMILLKKYPDKFSLQLDVRQWSSMVAKLKRGDLK